MKFHAMSWTAHRPLLLALALFAAAFAFAMAIPNAQRTQPELKPLLQTRLKFFFSEEAPAPTRGRPVFGATQPGGYSLAGHRLASYLVAKEPGTAGGGIVGGIGTGWNRVVGAVWRGDFDGADSTNPFCVQLCEDGARAFRSPICANMRRWEMLPNHARITHAYIFDRRRMQRPDCREVLGVRGVAAMPFTVYWAQEGRAPPR
jgi:hypothetical protein